MRIESLTVFNRHDNHDKVYIGWVDRAVEMDMHGRRQEVFRVMASWGARTSWGRGIDRLPSKQYDKVASARTAREIMIRLVQSKTAKGYTLHIDGVTPLYANLESCIEVESSANFADSEEDNTPVPYERPIDRVEKALVAASMDSKSKPIVPAIRRRKLEL